MTTNTQTNEQPASNESVGIHSCSYYCTRPECIKSQRDELRDILVSHKWKPERIQKLRPLTIEQIKCMDCRGSLDELIRSVRMTEAAHGIK